MFAISEPNILAPGDEGLPHAGYGAVRRLKSESTLHGNGCHDQPSWWWNMKMYLWMYWIQLERLGGRPVPDEWEKENSRINWKDKKAILCTVTFKRYFSLSESCFKQSPVRNESRNQYTWGYVWICEGELKIHKHRSQAEFDYVSLPELLEASGSCVG